eukprot:s3694_g13.t1
MVQFIGFLGEQHRESSISDIIHAVPRLIGKQPEMSCNLEDLEAGKDFCLQAAVVTSVHSQSFCFESGRTRAIESGLWWAGATFGTWWQKASRESLAWQFRDGPGHPSTEARLSQKSRAQDRKSRTLSAKSTAELRNWEEKLGLVGHLPYNHVCSMQAETGDRPRDISISGDGARCYTSLIPADSVKMLSPREAKVLDILWALIKVPWPSWSGSISAVLSLAFDPWSMPGAYPAF